MKTLTSIRPSHSFALDQLLDYRVGEVPEGYEALWRGWREEALQVKTEAKVTPTFMHYRSWVVYDLQYRSTDGVLIHGWLLKPKGGEIKRGMIVGHGYGGRDYPDHDLNLENTALLFFCARGISRSPHGMISHEPQWHVLHDIHKRDKYIMRGCVEDTWLAISAMENILPELKGRIGYMGSSFGGGIGAMALAWEDRVQRAHLIVPSFGYQKIRLKLKSVGSAQSVQRYAKEFPEVYEDVLKYYDAAFAAKYIRIPMHLACAKKDPVVTPPGQFAIYNELGCEKTLFALMAGHSEYPKKLEEDLALKLELESFFGEL